MATVRRYCCCTAGSGSAMDGSRLGPELLRNMVLLSVNYHVDALEPRAISAFEALLPGDSPVAAAYGLVSPDGPDHWPVVAAKGRRLAFEEPTFEL